MEVDANSQFNAKYLRDLLKVYYKRLYPHTLFYRWLSYGSLELFSNREFSFTIEEIYSRYLCYSEGLRLEYAICNNIPHKIDIGAIYNGPPKKVSSCTPIQKELVFDIDISDYDDVRTCCSSSNICQKCWKLMAIASQIIDIACKEDFGFKDIIWIFSGRRGIHAWICDYVARILKEHGRVAIAEYFNIISMGDDNMPRVLLSEPIHPSIKRALQLVEKHFKSIMLEDQDLFKKDVNKQRLILKFPDGKERKQFEMEFEKHKTKNSIEIWNFYEQYIETLRARGELPRKMNYVLEEIQLVCLYPRIDIAVTKGFNHLLKAPFCIHPKTGKVCIPFNVTNAFNFDVENVPTISNLLNEINEYDEKHNTQCSIQENFRRTRIEYKKTSLFKSIQIFSEFIRKLESRNSVTKSKTAIESMEF